MKKVIILVFLAAVAVMSVSGQYFGHEKETEELKKLYALNSLVFPSTTYPISRKQLIQFALELEEKLAGTPGGVEAGVLLEKLKNRDTIGIEAEASLLYTYRGDELWDDFYRHYYGMPPILRLYMYLYNDNAAFETAGSWRAEYESFPEGNVPGTREGKPLELDNRFLDLGLFSYQFEGMELLFGRTPVHFGDPDFSSLYPSNRLPFMDILGIKVPIGPVEMTGQIATLENREAVGDNYDPDNGKFSFEKNTILTALHRFEFRSSRFRTSIGAFSVIARPDNGFHLGDVFPVFSWHTADVGWHNMYLMADFGLTPFRGFNIFFQGGLGDVDADDLAGIKDVSGIPTIPAGVLGLSYLRGLNEDRDLKLTLELGKTHYLWGNFYGGEDDIRDEYFLKAVYRVFLDRNNRMMPLNSPYGPGAAWAEASAALAFSNGVTCTLRYFILSKNRLADLTTTRYEASNRVKEGPRDVINHAALNIDYEIEEGYRLFIEPAFIAFNNDYSFEVSLGGSVALSLSGKY